MIQVLCCGHLTKELIEQNVMFKFSTKFNDCHCCCHEKILALKCSSNSFLLKCLVKTRTQRTQRHACAQIILFVDFAFVGFS